MARATREHDRFKCHNLRKFHSKNKRDGEKKEAVSPEQRDINLTEKLWRIDKSRQKGTGNRKKESLNLSTTAARKGGKEGKRQNRQPISQSAFPSPRSSPFFRPKVGLSTSLWCRAISSFPECHKHHARVYRKRVCDSTSSFSTLKNCINMTKIARR